MIKAAIAYADGEGPPPALYRQWLHFRQYGLPPRAGGQADQPAGWLDRCELMQWIIQEWQDYKRAWARGDIVDWKRQNPEAAKLIAEVRRIVNTAADRD